MKEFKVGDEVIIRGFIESIHEKDIEEYPVKVLAVGTGCCQMEFTMDGKYTMFATKRALFHLSELESGDSKYLRDEIANLKQLLIEMYETKNYK